MAQTQAEPLECLHHALACRSDGAWGEILSESKDLNRNRLLEIPFTNGSLIGSLPKIKYWAIYQYL
jgi:hypothetical protein